ncbi:MAG: 3-phosphoshikimate 1-carboxyvinyltransferase [Pseudobdellovibrionaceae bacterium]
MKSFSFQGEIPASKSMMNRALLLQSYQPGLQIVGNSNCDDVRHMKLALAAFIQKKNIPCGEAGTVIRFMGMRASREKGTFALLGSPRLLSRPQDELIYILNQLSVNVQLLNDQIIIHSEGWKKPMIPIRVHRETSSQFATALLLNSWKLPFDLEFEMKPGVSEGYWQMSVELAQKAGLVVQKKGDFWKVPAQQELQPHQIMMEPDYSSAFALAAAGALCGETVITNATATSFQPDYIFIDLLKKMNIPVELKDQQLKVRQAQEIKPLDISLHSSPDLFPVLSVLCAFSKGESILKGATHLAHKESHRVEKTAELLRLAGFYAKLRPDGLQIQGQGKGFKPQKFEFDPDQDHRMAMAAGILKLQGFDVKIHQPQVVSKSFPEFWRALGIQA